MTHPSASNLVAVSVLLSFALASGNGGAAPDAAAPASAPAAAAPPASKVAGFDVTWKEMTPEQKAEHMKSTVLPKMKETFQAFDAAKFKEFKCTACHGKDAKAKKFKMPNPDILHIPGSPDAFAALLKEKPKLQPWAKFMNEQVKPQMAGLLGMHPFDPKKREAGGFGCGGCHVVDKPK